MSRIPLNPVPHADNSLRSSLAEVDAPSSSTAAPDPPVRRSGRANLFRGPFEEPKVKAGTRGPAPPKQGRASKTAGPAKTNAMVEPTPPGLQEVFLEVYLDTGFRDVERFSTQLAHLYNSLLQLQQAIDELEDVYATNIAAKGLLQDALTNRDPQPLPPARCQELIETYVDVWMPRNAQPSAGPSATAAEDATSKRAADDADAEHTKRARVA